MNEFDLIIIGGGIIGASIARELSKYTIKTAVIEKTNDVGSKTSNANSAIIHSGYDPMPGTLKAKFNVLGNSMFDQISKELDVKFFRIGSLTIATNEEQLLVLKNLENRAKCNGVKVELIDKYKLREMEPNISDTALGALYAPSAGIIDPFTLSIHTMENAVDNGVKLFRNNDVIGIKKERNLFIVKTNKDEFRCRIVINCAGNFSDKIASMIEPIEWSITSKKGEYFVIDHCSKNIVNHTIFPLPTIKGKGVLISSSTSFNTIVGPSNEAIDNKIDVSTDLNTLNSVAEQANCLVKNIPYGKVIRVFSGLRASCSRGDFIIEPAKSDKFFINVAGIESPGLASSPAIAKYVVEELVSSLMKLEKNSLFNPCIRKRHHYIDMLKENNFAYIKEHPEYGQLVCNCEKVSLGEIKDEFTRSIPPLSIKGLKRRTRAGFGCCQGSFCQTKVLFIIADALNISPLEVPLDEDDSKILFSKVKDI